MSLPNEAPRTPILCYVSDRHFLSHIDTEASREALLNKIQAAASAGVDWIQIREKDLSARDCALITRHALRRIAKSSAGSASSSRLAVNDRLDVAVSEHSGGVHLGEHGLPVAEVKGLVSSRADCKNFLIGASCHSLEAARSAEHDGANYIFFGPVFATPSKAAYGAPQGLERLAEICAAISIPVLAIGGITLENAARCLQSGAAGLAAIRLFQETEDLVSLALKLKGSGHY